MEPQEADRTPAPGRPERPTTQHRARNTGNEPLRPSGADLRGPRRRGRYNGNPAVRDISLDIGRNQITALIGPSGCGKSTLLRCFNRMNDLIPARR